MRGSAAFQISLRKFSIWRAAVGVLVLGVMAVMAAWAAHPGTVRNLPTGLALIGIAIAVAAAALWLAGRLWRVLPVMLSWDSEVWRLVPLASTPEEPETGRLEVHLDLGNWMLLRFVPEPPHQAHSRWLPAQREGSVHDWHALRCALYSPRSAPGSPSTQDGSAAP